MKILIDINHPGHVHLFRHFANEMQEKGHKILFTCRQKEYESELLGAYNFDFKCFGKHYTNTLAKIWGLFRFNFQLLITSLRFKPDIFFSHGSFYAAQVAWVLRKPHIAMEDTGNKEQMRLYLPFTQAVIMPDVLNCTVANKEIYFKGYNELAYLHPNKFINTNNGHCLLNIKNDEPYFILRFIAWNATHDKGHRGLLLDDKLNLINYLSQKGHVFITSEKELPKEIQQYKIKISPADIHQVLADATLVISEGATIATEAAVLGTPVIYTNSIITDNALDEKQYNILQIWQETDNLLDMTKHLLEVPQAIVDIKNGRNLLLQEKIDVTAFMVWFIENYPESKKTMQENPDYQLRFK